MQGLSCFWAIIPNREVKFICLPCLVLLAFLFFSLFCLLSWGQQIFSGDYLYTCEVFFLSLLLALLLGYYIISYPYHIIYLASISSYAFLFLCLKECYASVYLPLSSVYFPVLLFISFFLVILLLSLRNKTGEKRYFLWKWVTFIPFFLFNIKWFFVILAWI